MIAVPSNALSAVASSGGGVPYFDVIGDFSHSLALVDTFFSLIASSSFSLSVDTFLFLFLSLLFFLIMFFPTVCLLLWLFVL